MDTLVQILDYLLRTFFSLLLLVVMLRFLLQVVRADFYNPISQFIVKVTNPLLLPLRKLIPGLWGIDMAAVVLLLVVQLASVVVVILLYGASLPNILLLVVWSVLGILGLLLNFYFFALLAMIILSWVAPGTAHPAARLLYQITEPVMTPFRRLLPAMGGMDFSPILVFIGINVMQILLRGIAGSVGLPRGLLLGL